MNTFVKSSSSMFDTAAAMAILFSIFATGGAIVSESVAAHQTIKFEDSNLSTPAGVAALYASIQSAAVNVCTAELPRTTRVDQVDRCTHEATARAVRGVNVDALTAYFQSDRGQASATFASNLSK
jgi:UrcA family protein